MKQMIKRMTSAGFVFLLAGLLTLFGPAAVSASEEIDEALKTQLVMMAEGLTETIIPLSDEEIAGYQESADEFTASAMEAWDISRNELGELKDGENAETQVEMSGDTYVATVPRVFEKAEANFVYTFDEMGTPVSMSVDVQYPMSVTLQRAGLNTAMGLATVFLMLIFLSFIISLFKYIPKLLEGKKKEEKAAAPEQAVAAPAEAPVQAADDGELIAVIAAAIAASEGTSTDDFVVRSIRKINRKKW